MGGTRPEAKRLLNPSRPQNDRRLFPAVFTQKGKWLRDRFFGTDAVKSVHRFERQCADLAQMPSRMMARTVTDRMAAVAPRVRARAAEPLSGRLAPWQVKRACEKLEADLSGKLTLQEIAAELGISVSHFSRALRTFVGLPPHQRLLSLAHQRGQAVDDRLWPPDSCILSRPRSIASLRPAPYSAGLPRSRNGTAR